MNDDKASGFVLGLLVGAVLTFIFGGALAFKWGKEEIRTQAIKNGYGQWKVIDEEGKTEFEWLPKATVTTK